MTNERLYYFSELINLVAQDRITLLDDVQGKIESLTRFYDDAFRHTDCKVSPIGRAQFYILTHEIGQTIIGYQMFAISPSNKCELFEVFVSDSFRKKGIASNLIDSAIYFSHNHLKVENFEYHLLKAKNSEESILISVFNRLKETYPNLSFKDKIEG
ncbi:hypothetical protein BCU69_22185 [Vibrio cyclitrophicus]|uniref:GNAT family N-acetyltransferase n=1 Tax=Vibrio cyclitrophicus TaxID=47951 RepID=UPI000C818B1A|nr:GNAT family N-acetyltransferase [Vibrio cyclitrophicus]PMH36686.1 hypothetical protein BCU69_22185 [Vibrio cyclitrophicus]